VKETADIEFQVRSGNREEIPNPKGDQNIAMLSALIEVSWHQNPSARPTFKQITQKFPA